MSDKCWFILDDDKMKIEYPVMPDKFVEMFKKETLSAEDFNWLHENDLIDQMLFAKGGSFKFKADYNPSEWTGIIGSA